MTDALLYFKSQQVMLHLCFSHRVLSCTHVCNKVGLYTCTYILNKRTFSCTLPFNKVLYTFIHILNKGLSSRPDSYENFRLCNGKPRSQILVVWIYFNCPNENDKQTMIDCMSCRCHSKQMFILNSVCFPVVFFFFLRGFLWHACWCSELFIYTWNLLVHRTGSKRESGCPMQFLLVSDKRTSVKIQPSSYLTFLLTEEAVAFICNLSKGLLLHLCSSHTEFCNC